MVMIQKVLEYVQVLQDWGFFVSVVGIIFSLLACFLGYRAQKVWVALLGFVIGGIGGSNLTLRFVDNSVIEMLIAIIIGFFVAVIATAIYMLGLVLECFFFGFVIAGMVVPFFVSDVPVQLIVCGAVGLVAAILAIIFTKYIVIILTAIFGGVKLADFGLGLLGKQEMMIFLIASAVLVALGILVQILTTRRYKLDRGGFLIHRN